VIKFTNIFCPIDFSETSIRAFTCAGAIAGWYESRLEVLHVVPPFDSGLTRAMSDRFDAATPYPTARDEILAEIGRAINLGEHDRADARRMATAADMLGGQRIFGPRQGATTYRLLCSSATPVLALTPPWDG
jgi:hypothetical protein